MVTLSDTINYLGEAFRALFQGRVEDFIPNLIRGAPLVGVFFVIYGLVFALCAITLFKERENRRYAHYFAIGLGLVGTSQESVFGVINGLGVAMLAIVFIVLVVFFIANAYRRGNTSYLSETGEQHKAATGMLKEKKDMMKIGHEVDVKEKLDAAEDRDISQMDAALQDLQLQDKNLYMFLSRIQQALQNAAALVQQGQPIGDYKKRIVNAIKAQVPKLHLKKDTTDLQTAMKDLEDKEHQEIRIDHESVATTADLQSMIDQRIKALHDDNRLSTDRLKKEEINIRRLLEASHTTFGYKHKLLEQAREMLGMDENGNIKEDGRQTVGAEQAKITKGINNILKALESSDNIPEALNHFNMLRRDISIVEQESQQVRQLIQKIRAAIKTHEEQDEDYKAFINKLIKVNRVTRRKKTSKLK